MGLASLPADIQIMVLEDAVMGYGAYFFVGVSKIPGICQINREFRNLAMPMFYKLRTFCLRSRQLSIPPRSFNPNHLIQRPFTENIRHLNLDAGNGVSANLRLLGNCFSVSFQSALWPTENADDIIHHLGDILKGSAWNGHTLICMAQEVVSCAGRILENKGWLHNPHQFTDLRINYTLCEDRGQFAEQAGIKVWLEPAVLYFPS